MTTLPSTRLRVLVASPSTADVGAVAAALGVAGHEVATAYRLEAAVARLAAEPPDVVVADAALVPGAPSEVVGRLRGHGDAPLLVLADVGDEGVVTAAFDAGAADVVWRPIRPLELLARVMTAARRATPAPARSELPDGLRLDLGSRRAEVAGRPLGLTRIELDLLAAMAARRGAVVDHRLLVRAAWADPSTVDAETLRAHLGRLNAKLVEAGHPGLRNVRGRGYGLRVHGSAGGE
jgi:DNA-binding response OmpR family regulator